MPAMDVPSGLLSLTWLLPAWLLFVLVTAVALRAAHWPQLRDSADLNVWLGATLVVMLLWLIRGGISPGLGFHILGVTCLTLMFGWAFAWFSLLLVLLATTAYGLGGWDTLAVNALLMGGIPILLTQGLLRLCQSHLPHNFFIYVLLNAFFAAGLSSLVAKLAVVGLLLLAGAQRFETVAYEYLPWLPMMFLSEALINGMIMTMLVALRPEWVSSFQDDLYLKGK
jgi:uncharacterized membrane protein